METQLILLLTAVTVSVGILSALVLTALADRTVANSDARKELPYDNETVQIRQRELAVPALSRLVAPLMKRAGDLALRYTPTTVVERLDEQLRHAGAPLGWTGDRVLAIKVVAPVVMAVAFGVAGTTFGLSPLRAVMAAGAGAALGYYGPEWVLRSRARKRQHEISRNLPDALDLLSITVEAGLGFNAAMNRVSREIGGALGGELYRVVAEVRLGKSRREAMRSLGKRTGVEDLKTFVAAMVQADAMGMPISKVLRIQSEELRLRRKQAAEEKAQKLPVKIIFPLILCIFPSIFAVLLGPAAIQIYNNFITQV